MTARTADCPQHVRAGRFCKAEQFHDAAQGVLALVDDDDNVSDAFVTLCGRRPGAVAAAVFDLLDAYDSRLRHVAREWLDQSAARLRDLGPQDVQPGAADRAAAGLSCTTSLTLIARHHTMSVMVVGVGQVAAELGVSPSRVRALIAAGTLPATKVSGSYVLDQDAVDLLAARERPAHVRAFSVRMAWACAAAADGVRPIWISDAELSRLRRRLDTAPASPGLWQARLAALTRHRLSFRVGGEQLEALLVDPRVARTGTSAVAAGSDPRAGSGPAAVWVRTADDLTDLGQEYGLLPAESGNLTVSVAGTPQVPWLGGSDGDAFRLVVAADLLSVADARSRRTGRELLRAALVERSWRSLRPAAR